MTKEVVIVSSVRTAVGKSGKGSLRVTRPDDLAATAIKGALERVPQIDPKEIEDVIIGCATPEAEQGMNVARIASLRAGLPVEVSAMTINRFCSSGLQAISLAADSIMAGRAEIAIGGGVESMSMIPMGGHKVSANPWLVGNYPDAYLSMGLTAERLAKRFGITREQADEFSLNSHKKALAAIQAGKFEDEIVPVPVSFTTPNGSKPKRIDITFKVDEGPRADTTLEALASLRPAFHAKGTVTAGNSSQTSDGAAASVLMSADKARQLGIKPLARFVAFATAGYKPEEMGLGPVYAIPKVLKMAGPEAGRYFRIRVERSLRRAGAVSDQGSRAGYQQDQPERRRGGTGSSAGLHRSQADGDDHPRIEADEREIRHCDHVHWRRYGSGGDY